MEADKLRIQRNSTLIKGFMALMLFIQAVQIYQTQVWDMGELAGVFGFLLLLKGILCSPQLLLVGPEQWFKTDLGISRPSVKYFALGAILLIVALF